LDCTTRGCACIPGLLELVGFRSKEQTGGDRREPLTEIVGRDEPSVILYSFMPLFLGVSKLVQNKILMGPLFGRYCFNVEAKEGVSSTQNGLYKLTVLT
jgi:hypothetical protein